MLLVVVRYMKKNTVNHCQNKVNYERDSYKFYQSDCYFLFRYLYHIPDPIVCQNTTFATEYGTLQYYKNSRGNIVLNLDGHPYTVNRKRGDITYWECCKRRTKGIHCKSRMVTIGSQIKHITDDHNHV